MVRPRPLVGLPAVDPREVARAWLVARIAAVPLDRAAALASLRFAERAPALCGSLLAALADDAALSVLGEAGEALALLAADGAGHEAGDPTESAAAQGWEDRTGAPADALAITAGEQLRAAVAGALLPNTDPALHAGLHDRLAHACTVLALGALARADEPDAIVVRDARPHADPRAHLTTEAERLVVAGTHFALLAVEVEDAAVIPAGVLAAAEAALHAALPAGTLHAPDGPGSLLVLAAEVDGRALAQALTRAVAAAGSHHGAPLRAAAGVAQHPEDSDTPEGLLARADGELFAARAEGLPLV